jgi:hypothetical protein
MVDRQPSETDFFGACDHCAGDKLVKLRSHA